jgi:hypothetical protein
MCGNPVRHYTGFRWLLMFVFVAQVLTKYGNKRQYTLDGLAEGDSTTKFELEKKGGGTRTLSIASYYEEVHKYR